MKKDTTIEQLFGIKEQIEDILDQISGQPVPAAPKSPGRAATARGSQTGKRGAAAAAAAAAGNNKLAIVVGHTRLAPGASGVAPISASEYTWNTDLAQKIKAHAATKGVAVEIFFRDGHGISGAYAQVRQWGARAAIELHFNAFNGRALGTETLHGTSFAGSQAWAKAVQAAMVTLYGRGTGLPGNRGLKPAPPHDRGRASVNALSSIASCLIEPFFGDNPAEAALGQSRKQGLAEALVAAFKSHFGV